MRRCGSWACGLAMAAGTASGAVWPVYLVNDDGSRGAAAYGVMQGYGDGSINSVVVPGMHEGFDIFVDGQGGHEVSIIRPGVVIERVTASNGTLAVRVNVGTAQNPVYETDRYLHIANIPAGIVVDGAVTAGEKAGNISTTAFSNGSRHFHLSVYSGVRTTQSATTPGGIVSTAVTASALLNPLARLTAVGDQDPGGNLPALADSNADGRSIVFTTKNTLTRLPDGTIKGGVDIVADVRDDMNPAFRAAAGPYKIGYYVKSLAKAGTNHGVRTAASPYVLAKFDDAFFNNGGSGPPTGLGTRVYASTPEWRVTQNNSVPGYNSTVFPMTKNYIVTNTRGGTGSVANTDANQFWNTKAVNLPGRSDNHALANMSDVADATTNANARFKDGDYEVHVVAADLTHADQDLNAGRVRVANFKRTVTPGLAAEEGFVVQHPELFGPLFDRTTPWAPGYEPTQPEISLITTTFPKGRTLAVSGTEFYPDFVMPVYVQAHQAWTDGMAFLGQAIGWVFSDAVGMVSPTFTTYVTDVGGMYDVIIDYDRDGRFSAGLDALGGFAVIPEPAGTSAAAAGMILIATTRRGRRSRRAA